MKSSFTLIFLIKTQVRRTRNIKGPLRKQKEKETKIIKK